MIRWLFSKTHRDACAMRNHVYRMLSAQRDLMTPAASQLVAGALAELQAVISNPDAKKGELRKKMETLEEVANKWLKPYPNAAWRENVEVLLVAIAVAMGIRTFFLQPFKIPTGSLQPTLYGVTSKNLLGVKNFQIPTGVERVKEWFEGYSYIHVTAQTDGNIESVERPFRFLIFNIWQTFTLGGVKHTIWFPPDMGEAPPGELPLVYRAGWEAGHVYHKGDDVVKLEVHAGDHLFVDRLTYNFRKPERGEIVVFETLGISEEQRDVYGIPPNEFYIKRLVGLSGETIWLKQDYEVAGVPLPQYGGHDVPVGHLVVDGQPLSASTPHFENLYSFSDPPVGAKILQYQENHYYGHAMLQDLAPGREFQIRANYLFVMGDNTMNSLDSRYWGDFPASSIVGKSFFVYWPLTRRFGFGNE